NNVLAYTFLGNGSLVGSVPVVKQGLGAVTWAGTNTFFNGPIIVQNGILKQGISAALGTTNGATVINNGGTLDLNGLSVNAEPIIASGSGYTNGGAIINSGG